MARIEWLHVRTFHTIVERKTGDTLPANTRNPT